MKRILKLIIASARRRVATPTPPAEPEFLLMESGDFLLLESGDKFLKG